MKKLRGFDGSIDTELNSLLTVWAQSNALPELRADAIQRAAKQDAWAEGAPALKAPIGKIKGMSVSYADLPSKWWFGFAHDLAGALTQASRSWSLGGDLTGIHSV